MDTLKNKKYGSFDYICRYSKTPYYYDTLHNREVFGLTTKLKKSINYISHKVSQEDTLDILALKYYNDPTLWWVIADFNDIIDPFIDITQFSVLKIPNISSIEIGGGK